MALPMTVPEVANRWRCGTSHVYNLIADGALAHFRVGKLIRIPLQAVEAYECCASSTTAENGLSSSTSTDSVSADPSASTQPRQTTPPPSAKLLISKGRSLPVLVTS